MSTRDVADWREELLLRGQSLWAHKQREAVKQARAKEREQDAPLIELLEVARRIEKHLRNLEYLKRLPPSRLGRPPKETAR